MNPLLILASKLSIDMKLYMCIPNLVIVIKQFVQLVIAIDCIINLLISCPWVSFGTKVKTEPLS